MTRTLALCAAITGLILLARSARPRAGAGRYIRAAGPDQMRNPPADWTDTDERLDESFPASDPPGTY